MSKKFLLILLISIILGGLSFYKPINWTFKGENEINLRSNVKFEAITALLPFQFRDLKIAKEYNIKGYVDISLQGDSPLNEYSLSKPQNKGVYLLKRGSKLVIPILLKFVSYDPNSKEAHLSFDPKDLSGGQVEVYYLIRDKNSNVIGKDKVTINDYISYDKKSLTLKAGETEKILMTLDIPEDFPDNVQTFILQPYGIICEDTSIPLVPGEKNAPEFNVCIIGDS
jgi:hypothetical protein